MLEPLARFCGLILLVFGVSAWGQEPEQVAKPRSISTAQLVAAGHYDRLVADFALIAAENVELALSRNYYVPLKQREQLLLEIERRFSRQKMRQSLIAKLANSSAVTPVRQWFSSELGEAVSAGIQPAYAPGAGKKQQLIAAALEADSSLLDWWQQVDNRDGLSEQWLQQRQRTFYENIVFIADLMKPNTPFEEQLFLQKLQQDSFDLRPEINRQWRLRFLDSVRNLEVTALLRYQEFTLTSEYAQFMKVLKRESDAVITESIAEFQALFAEIVAPPAPVEEPELPKL